VGKQFPFVSNLEPRTIKGLESNGMIFVIGKGETFAFLNPSKEIPAGTKLG
jgi:tRNA-binding EMAP/Myf-like protein